MSTRGYSVSVYRYIYTSVSVHLYTRSYRNPHTRTDTHVCLCINVYYEASGVKALVVGVVGAAVRLAGIRTSVPADWASLVAPATPRTRQNSRDAWASDTPPTSFYASSTRFSFSPFLSYSFLHGSILWIPCTVYRLS